MCTDQAAQRLRRTVQWRDLVHMTVPERIWEACLSLPWLAGSLVAYHAGYIALGALCSFFFFLTGLRQSHGAQHYSLGLPRRAQDLMLFGLSASMLACMHALQAAHLKHHRCCLEDDDMEGFTARLPWWRAILMGPVFVYRVHASGWQLSTPAKRRWIAAEALAIATVIAVAFAVPALHALRWHVGAMAAGECLAGFFAVWTVHHGGDEHTIVTRTQRGRLVNLVFYNMFYHAEHHLFPMVPTCHMRALAQRIDQANSNFASLQVISLPTAARSLEEGQRAMPLPG